MRVSLFEARFSIDLMENDFGTIIGALIYYGEKEMDGNNRWLARERLLLADELRKNLAATLDEHKRDYLGVQIEKRLEALDG
jgi:hypothetical protein